MKIVIFGLGISSSWGNGHATLWRGLCRSLGDLGHDVVFYERDVPYYAAHRDLVSPPNYTLRLYASWADELPRARRDVATADVAMVTSYCPDGIAASALVLESKAPVRAFYDLDTPVTLARLEAGESVPYLPPEGLGDFDLVLSYTGGAALDALRTRLGATHVAPLYGSVDPDVHRPAAPNPTYAADLSYLGTYAADRQAMLATLLLEPARRSPHRRFLIGGALYPRDFPWAPNIWYRENVPPADHPSFYSSSPLTLNVTRKAMADMGFCPSGRMFEAAACGAPILSDAWAGLDQFFTPGDEIFLATSSDAALEVLALPKAELAKVAARARARTLEEHTARRRAEELVRLVHDTPAAPSARPTTTLEPHVEA